jgi:hypothetical protein
MAQEGANQQASLESGSASYEVIRQRLNNQGDLLRKAVAELNAKRQETFGAVEYKLLQSERIVTSHNCIPQDMVKVDGETFLFGFNTRLGLKRAVDVADVFGLYRRDELSGSFKELDLTLLQNPQFETDFQRLYNVYEKTEFKKFALVDNQLYMKFATGASAGDLAVFKWAIENHRPYFVDGRAEGEYRRLAYPPSHPFVWSSLPRSAYRYGDYPHASVEDLVFLSCTGGSLTIKVEDNTESGAGIYAEPVDDPHQKVDDAEIAYGKVGELLVLRVRPYKEAGYRYFIFNKKLGEVVRVDGVGSSCAALPESQGLIFPGGYYLSTGTLRQFEKLPIDMVLERVVVSPNGEDFLYVFYNRGTGEYGLMPYRLIAQKVEERIICHGFSLFPTGQMVALKADSEPQKHHLIQIRQTPFYQLGFEPEGRKDLFLHKVGNKEVVRCLSDCNEILLLIEKGDFYEEVYADIFRRCELLLDTYAWLNHAESKDCVLALQELKKIADLAVDEFDKVKRERAEAKATLTRAQGDLAEEIRLIKASKFTHLGDYVSRLYTLRMVRGRLASLRSIRYINLQELAVLEDEAEKEITALTEGCVASLLQKDAFISYQQTVEQLSGEVAAIPTAMRGKELASQMEGVGHQLEMLIEMVNGLGIEDAVDNTKILEEITSIYARLNQVRAELKNRIARLTVAEQGARFSAQMALLDQAVSGYLGLSDTLDKCDENWNKLAVQLEELEGIFADVDDYVLQLEQKRTEIQDAFEQKKTFLTEQRSKKSLTLVQAAERILGNIKTRLLQLGSPEEMAAYMTSDALPKRVNHIAEELLHMGEVARAEEVTGRLKVAHQDALRQQKDKAELFVDGQTVIKLGSHHFNVNLQDFDLTVVTREGLPHLHITGTQFYETVDSPELHRTSSVWGQVLPSENDTVYRGEVLAWKMFEQNTAGSLANHVQLLPLVRKFSESHYQDGYVKGIHDEDSARILELLQHLRLSSKSALFSPRARALALGYWCRWGRSGSDVNQDVQNLWRDRLAALGERSRLFPEAPTTSQKLGISSMLGSFLMSHALFPNEVVGEAAEYLIYYVTSGEIAEISQEADALLQDFDKYLATNKVKGTFAKHRERLSSSGGVENSLVEEFQFIREWLTVFHRSRSQGVALVENSEPRQFIDEAAAVLFCGDTLKRRVLQARLKQDLKEMRGSHPLIKDAVYSFDYLDLADRMQNFNSNTLPLFQQYQGLKALAVSEAQQMFRLKDMRPSVLPSFVRNQLIDQVYLPLLGANLAKQIGVAGEKKRTDLMGLLLVISPPGYGKTTLVEYLASRLGMAFVKVNGPALGDSTISLDPDQAPNESAKEELRKLNLAFEMGDNIMICVDDIQHCSPEFLQKFISLCDGQRKIEGVWRGKGRTYNLRGRRVAVVMAGNPYTESGQKFKIPDMLANRADVYNLGDLAGSAESYFADSYIENAAMTNPVLARVMGKNPGDFRKLLKAAQSSLGAVPDGLEESYSAAEAEDALSILKKLIRIRNLVMEVNRQYILSAGQSEEFREEPPFRLQGSYRNMNRLAEQVLPVMSDAEIDDLVIDHYRREAQTLASNTEANFLKFKVLAGFASKEEKRRWEDIVATFRKNASVRGLEGNTDPTTRAVAQLAAVQDGLLGIKDSLDVALRGLGGSSSLLLPQEQLEWLIAELKKFLSRDSLRLPQLASKQLDGGEAREVVEFELTPEMLTDSRAFYEHFSGLLKDLRKKHNIPDTEP